MGNTADKSSEEQSFSVFVKNGESVDEVLSPNRLIPRSESKSYDAPLTKIGVAQATLTGLFLQKQFDDIIQPD